MPACDMSSWNRMTRAARWRNGSLWKVARVSPAHSNDALWAGDRTAPARVRAGVDAECIDRNGILRNRHGRQREEPQLVATVIEVPGTTGGPTRHGYTLVALDGGIFAYEEAPYQGFRVKCPDCRPGRAGSP
jgi:hypothetical protein